MLEISSLSKSHDRHFALRNLSFTVEAGEIVAFVGPNGAGKSTLFNILAGVLERDEGTLTLDGSSLSLLPLKDLGFLPEEMFQYDRFTAEQMLAFDISMRDIIAPTGFDTLVSKFAIEPYLHERMDSLSQGMSKRVAIASVFLGDPRLLILDEPLNGLDIQSVIALRELLKENRERGGHILISSHILSFVDEMADRVLFLKEGRLVGQIAGNNSGAETMYRQLFM